MSKRGKVGLEFPINFHANNDGMRGYSTGINLKLYFKGKGEGIYFGPSFLYGRFYRPNASYYDNRGGRDIIISLKAGYQYQVTKVFGLNLGGPWGIPLK